MIKFVALALIGLLPVTLMGQNEWTNKVTSFDRYAEQSRQQWQVPGMAVVVVKNGEVLLAKGYGKRKVDGPESVDEQTLFACASTTKAMTACALGMLVDEGKLRWDDPVTQHLPEFQLADPYATRSLRVRDLLTHNGGLGNADFLWAGSDLTAADIMARLRHAELAYPLRGGYTYQNIMYLVAGEVIARISGKSWAEFLTERIFRPLGMTRTFTSRQASLSESNRSTPHFLLQQKITPIQDESADAIGPAGSVWSCAADMAKWVRFVLDSARSNGRRFLQPTTYAAWFTPQVVIPTADFYPTTALTKPNFTTYALGWFQHDYHRQAIDFHTGSLAGTTAILGLQRQEQLGIYVFGNLDHAEVRHALMYKAFDWFGTGGAPGRDWSAEFQDLYRKLAQQQEAQAARQEKERIPGTKPSHSLGDYTGTYAHPFFGSVTVSLEAGQLKVVLSSKIHLKLEHWHHQTFRGQYNLAWWGKEAVVFQTGFNGLIEAVRVGGSPALYRQ